MGMIINRRRVYGGKKDLPYGAVDMGLPSGTLWAQGNIVKDAQGNYAIGEPTDYGCYFSWGNIDGHNEGDEYSFSNANYALTPGSQLTGDIPSNDALYDAAVARIGSGWRMPTNNDLRELFNNSYTTSQRTSINGINGYLVTSKINNNTLFMSASGHRYDLILNNKTIHGNYWSNSYISRIDAYSMYFNPGGVLPAGNYLPRRYGLTIRPVYTPNN